jgi:hypothetical protein
MCFHSFLLLLLYQCHVTVPVHAAASPFVTPASSLHQHPTTTHSVSHHAATASASFPSSPLSSSSSSGHYVKVVNCSDQGLTSLLDAAIPHDTESIDLSHNQLNDLHNKIPAAVSEHLLHLDVSFNEIRQLGRGHIFTNFTHLRHLDLSGNHLKTLFAGVFRGMKRLESLIMSQGELRYIDEHAFDGLENLRHLDLESNQIASIYLELFQSILNLRVSLLLLPGSYCSSSPFFRSLVSWEHPPPSSSHPFAPVTSSAVSLYP